MRQVFERGEDVSKRDIVYRDYRKDMRRPHIRRTSLIIVNPSLAFII